MTEICIMAQERVKSRDQGDFGKLRPLGGLGEVGPITTWSQAGEDTVGGGGGPWVSGLPPTPQRKNFACVPANGPRFSTKHLPGAPPPPFPKSCIRPWQALIVSRLV